MNVSPAWLGLIRLRRRLRAADRLVEARLAKTEAYRAKAFGSPPMTPEEVQEHEAAVRKQRERDGR